jgi:short-subunit dehydrogenase
VTIWSRVKPRTPGIRNGIRPLAVVTGASSGIGLELAKRFAAADFDLVVTAEDDHIDTVAHGIRASGVEADAVQVDLATEEGVTRLVQSIRRPVDALALNAGIGAGGAFVSDEVKETYLQDELKLIDLNVRSTVHIAKLLLPNMVERGRGRVLFTSSIASTMPGSFQAVYNASKSFVQSFALALRSELKDTGVTVTSLMPGPTETKFFERADMLDTKVGAGDKDDAADVARDGFEAMMAGRESVVSHSASTKAQGRFDRLLPERVKAQLHRRMAEPGSARR